jgi:hypothetical protein
MKSRWVYSLLGSALLLGATAVRAQEPPPGPDMMGPGGPIRGRMEILGFGEMHPGKVVTGAPYSAVAVTESKQTLADGNTINRKVQANVFRDGQGRTRRETTLPSVGPLAASGQPKSFIMIFDPVATTAFVLHPDTKVAEQLPAPRGGKNPAALQDKFEARMQQHIADGTLKKEDLGVQTINGISAQGTRYTHTIPAGQIGNDKAIIVVSERWYSPDLQIVVKSTHTDPRFGETTYTLTNIQRAEPTATLFAVPADYTVEQAKPRFRGHGGHGAGTGPGSSAPPAGAPADAPPPPPGE